MEENCKLFYPLNKDLTRYIKEMPGLISLYPQILLYFFFKQRFSV